MGAALTYARRYALFTLVGIAGEDDLDTPDLLAPTTPAPKTEAGKTKGRLNGGPNYPSRGQSGSGLKKAANPVRTLEAKASAVLRDQLIAQLKGLNSAEEAADWAHRVLTSKNSLVLAHAEQVELAFQLKLSTLMTDQPSIAQQPEAPRRRRRRRDRATGVNKTVLTLPVPRRIRDREHVKSVAKQPCLVCGRRPADAEDYKAFEAAITADYDAQSAVERELILRLASLLWRLRRATTMETGLFEIQAGGLGDYRQSRQLLPDSRDVIHAVFGRTDSDNAHAVSRSAVSKMETVPNSGENADAPNVEFARCFLRLANLPNFALDRLSRYEATLWRQVGRILYALETLDRRKPQERMRRLWLASDDQIEQQ